MKEKLKIRNEQHPSLNEVLEKYDLKAERLFANEPLMLVVEYDSGTNAGRELKECADVIEMYVEPEEEPQPL